MADQPPQDPSPPVTVQTPEQFIEAVANGVIDLANDVFDRAFATTDPAFVENMVATALSSAAASWRMNRLVKLGGRRPSGAIVAACAHAFVDQMQAYGAQMARPEHGPDANLAIMPTAGRA